METQIGHTKATVLWINGAFGAGKTTAARLLAAEYPTAAMVDPEEVGSLLRQILQPIQPVRDFQEWRAWRSMVSETLNSVLFEMQGDSPIAIVSQTITNESYWKEIISRLSRSVEVVPVALLVAKEEHHRRVTEDHEEPDALCWRLSKFGAFERETWIEEAFKCIETTALAPEEVAAQIAEILCS